MKKFKEWLSIKRAKNPAGVVLGVILLINICVIAISAFIISAFHFKGTDDMNFFVAAYKTIAMVLDPGCISEVIADVGSAGVFISIFCLVVVIVGMVAFTGAVIGYVTNYISSFIEQANSGRHKLYISNHVVILNWNSRASEIINDFLYKDGKQNIVVLVSSRKEEIEREIEERLSDTIARENKKLVESSSALSWFKRKAYIRKNKIKKNITVFVREGDVFSSTQLDDISLDRARSIIILGNDINSTGCKYELNEILENNNRGNSLTVKTLMQVADITSKEESDDNQRIIVEVTDEWTSRLVDEIIKSKEVKGECSIVPIRVNQVLGQILSQFSLMPELNMVYAEMFSNRGAEFYAVEQPTSDMKEYAKEYLKTHMNSIPLAFMESKGTNYCFYAANDDTELDKVVHNYERSDYSVDINRNYWIEHKNVVILGHNSKSRDIMQGFVSFSSEWVNNGEQIVSIVVIDDKNNLEKMDYYKDYPFVVKTVPADVYDRELICKTIEEFVKEHDEDTSILILSDDSVVSDDIDANALANLIIVEDIIKRKSEEPDYVPGSIDVIVEIIDPKHYDLVSCYNVNNVVISNRYISKMIAQIGECDALFDFYNDILSYDDGNSNENSDTTYDSKEIYVKKVSRYFNEVPAKCTAAELIRAVLDATTSEELPEAQRDAVIMLGYVKPGKPMVIFGSDQRNIEVELGIDDKIILFASH